MTNLAPKSNNPANHPDFLVNLLDRMEKDPKVRQAVHHLFLRGDLEFLLHDTQLEMKAIVDGTNSDEVLIFCSRQLGKSFFVIVYALIFCLKNPKTIVRIFSHTIEQVADIVNDNLRVIEQLAPPGLISRKKSDKRWQVGFSEIRLGPLSKAHVDGKRGGNASLIILEEGGFSPSDDYRSAIGSVINPQLLRSGGKLIHVTTPSEDVNHYVHTEVLPKCELAGSVARYDIYRNPQITPEQVQKAKDRCTSPQEWDREYLVQIVRDEISTVIPEFDQNRHIKTLTPPSHAHWQTALDFGGVMDKHALLLMYYDFQKAKYCIYDERFLEKNSPTQEIITAALDMEASGKWLDPEYRRRVSDAPGQVRVDLTQAGFVTNVPKKEQGSWEAWINALRTAFQQDLIEIDPRCVHLIATLKYGQYTSNRKDFKRTQQLGHLDLLAALGYGYRHQIKSNPFPNRLGKNRQDHYIPEADDDDSSRSLAQAILPGF